jgi:ABC-2 type transport system ATP-binding protein
LTTLDPVSMRDASASRGVHIRALEKSYGRGTKLQHVLRGVDLEVGPGEVVGLIGPNGAGKTTLMSCLLGYLIPDAGTLTIDGQRTDDIAIRQRVGFVPERMNFDRRSTGRAFLRYMGRLAGLAAPQAAERAEMLLARLDLTAAGEKRLSQYSRGMLQRIGMCQALIGEPDFLFLDEPTSGLDPNGVMLVRDVIFEQRQRGAAVLLNSHQLTEMERVCDRVLFLSGGRISQQQELHQRTTIPLEITLLAGFDPGAIQTAAGVAPFDNVVHVDVASEAEIAGLVRRLVESGAGVVGVTRRKVDLEQIFRSQS